VLVIIIVGIFVLILSNRNGSKNYNDAFVEKNNEKSFIKLRGRRSQMVHDPISIFLGKTYDDSLLIPLEKMSNGIIKGGDIPREKGYYKYSGNISINGNKIIVSLFVENTDDKIVEPVSWNGEYNLMKK